MRAFLSEERNVLRIRAAEPFGECGGPEREWGGGGEGREGFRRHYRGHCPPEIIKLKSNYGLIIVNPPPIPKSFLCSKLGWNRGGGGVEGRVRWLGRGLLDEWRVSGNVRMNCSKRGIYRYNATRLRGAITGGRGTKLFAVNVTFQLRWFRCLWQVLKPDWRARFSRPYTRGKWFRFLKILSEIDR